ncbi:MAG: Bax inhibitor-1/YccA family protein, partial [Mesorhizobium sp.]
MNSPNLGYRMGTGVRAGALYDEGLRRHMLRVYNYMGLGLVVTGLVALVVASTPALYVPIFSTPLKWVVMLAPLAFVMFFSFKMQTMSAASAQAMFWAFCAVMGLSLASVFLVFTGTSIARTFFIAATMFGATSLYGYTTKRDLTQFSSFLIMGLIGVVIASLVNLFLGSTALQFAISVIGIAVFIGLTAWDTQTIKEQYA